MKIKIEKGERVFYDAPGNRLTNGQWAFRLLHSGPRVEVADKELAGLILSGKSFTRENKNSYNFEGRIPNFNAIMDESWARDKSLYSKAERTGYGWRMFGRYWIVEYQNEKGEKIYFKEDYSTLIEESEWPLWVRDGNSPGYLVEKQGQDYVFGVIMPCKGPEERK